MTSARGACGRLAVGAPSVNYRLINFHPQRRWVVTTAAQAPSAVKSKKRKAVSKDYVVPSRFSFAHALKKGSVIAKLSFFVLGLGNLVHKQIVKGLAFLAIEVFFIWFMVANGAHNLSQLTKLGSGKQVKVKVNGFWVYKNPDPSVEVLLYGVITVVLVLLFIWVMSLAMSSAYKAEVLAKERGHAPTIVEDFKSLANENASTSMMFLPTLGIFIFTILPLIFMISMAFTNYDADHVDQFSWTGFAAFKQVFSSTGSTVNASLFFSVLAWTLIWAFFATFLNYFLGLFMAMLINRKTTRLKGFWRAIFSMSIAVPQFVSLLVMRTMLQRDGAINRLLESWGWINGPLPWLSDPTWARVTVIVINLWVGIPFTIMQVTGILQNIPADLYEAAKIDGANWWQIFRKITMPYLFFVMTPYLITTFMGNVNNFNVIYLLTNGDPTPVGASAGKTDLLVTWLYKLTVDKQNYSLGAVIGIMTFIVLAVVSLITYRNSGSYKNEEGFQ